MANKIKPGNQREQKWYTQSEPFGDMKFALSVAAALGLLAQSTLADSFIKTSGTKFTLNGQPFYFSGSNACMYYQLVILASIIYSRLQAFAKQTI